MRTLMQIVSVSFVGLFVTVSFQNCAQSNWGVGLKDGGQLAKASDGPVQPHQADELVIPIDEPVTLNDGSDGDSSQDETEAVSDVSIDLENQEISLILGQVNNGVGLIPGQIIRCDGLSEEVEKQVIARIQHVLNQSTVCKNEVHSKSTGPQFVACTQIYKSPYAKLVSKKESVEVELGEQLDSCSSIQDICGDNQKLLVNEIRHLMNELRALGCLKGKAACESGSALE